MNRDSPLLERLYRAALDGADPARGVATALCDPAIARRLDGARRVGVFAVGKAAARMLEAVPGERFDRALCVVPNGTHGIVPSGAGRTRIRSAEILEASHPEPDRSSVEAAHRAVEFFEEHGRGDVILCLVSGGTSSLLCLPRPGLTLAEKRRRIRRLTRSGAPIGRLNRLRTSLSAVKGGRLGRRTEATVITLVLSDVPGDDPRTVGSGPTIRGKRRDVARVIGSNASGLAAAKALARSKGFGVVERRRLAGEAAAEGDRIGRAAARLRPETVMLAGGETTVRLGKGSGTGGRTMELALGAARVLEGLPVALLSAGSDGRDGSGRAAGAFVDGSTLARARRLGAGVERALDRHDTETFFESLGDLLVTGPTGTNVADWVFAIRR